MSVKAPKGLFLHDEGHNLAWSACFINPELIDLKTHRSFYIDVFAALLKGLLFPSGHRKP